MSEIPLCPYCKHELYYNLNYTLDNDMYICWDDIGHAFVYFSTEKKFGLIININKDKLAAGTFSISINDTDYSIPDNFNIYNCCEILMSYYKRFINNRAFS